MKVRLRGTGADQTPAEACGIKCERCGFISFFVYRHIYSMSVRRFAVFCQLSSSGLPFLSGPDAYSFSPYLLFSLFFPSQLVAFLLSHVRLTIPTARTLYLSLWFSSHCDSVLAYSIRKQRFFREKHRAKSYPAKYKLDSIAPAITLWKATLTRCL